MNRRDLLQLLFASAMTAPRVFTPPQIALLRALCQHIIPPEGDDGGAVEAGAPEFIHLLASENAGYQLRLSGGLVWLNSTCAKRYGVPFLDCTVAQQIEMLHSIAYRANAASDPTLQPGVEFFSLLRDLTLDGFFTSKIGVAALRFRGNAPLKSFPGCSA